jgi:hypothetical protein
VLSRYAESAFRKPCFAGERYAVALRAFEHAGKLGAVGGFYAEGDSRSGEAPGNARPHCCVRMLFE